MANGSKGLVNVVPLSAGSRGQLPRNLASTALSNVCKFKDDGVDRCTTDLAAMDLTSDAFVERSKECQEVVMNDAVEGVPTVYQLQPIGMDTTRVGGIAYQIDAINGAHPDVTQIYIKAG